MQLRCTNWVPGDNTLTPDYMYIPYAIVRRVITKKYRKNIRRILNVCELFI
jgi:hypothetical protein